MTFRTSRCSARNICVVILPFLLHLIAVVGIIMHIKIT